MKPADQVRIVFETIAGVILGALIGQTGVTSGLASIAEPLSPIRNQASFALGIVGGVVGIVVGILLVAVRNKG